MRDEDQTCPSTLTEDQLAAFERDGFLAIDNVVPPEDLAPIETEYAELLDRLATDLMRRAKFRTAMKASNSARATRGDRRISGAAPVPEHLAAAAERGARADTYHMHHGPAVFELMRHPRILDVVEDIIGPEISPARSSRCG